MCIFVVTLFAKNHGHEAAKQLSGNMTTFNQHIDSLVAQLETLLLTKNLVTFGVQI